MKIEKPHFLYRLFRAFTPPIIFNFLMKYFTKEELFDGVNNAILFKKYILGSKVYAEYGCGLSTQYVLKKTTIPVFSVDSSHEWVEIVKTRSNNPKQLHIHHANIGEVGDWGRPINYKNRTYFKEYTNWIWEQNIKPDTVLIDGRFRVACFLTCLLKASENTKIIFDDYTNRPEYHIVEEFLSIKETCGRQALFVVENFSEIQVREIATLLDKFRYVMD